ncbi:hypothetical protein [Streptomyces sp. NPDC001536]|uniref:hypothetical protein n=1 Tax=Streptomyces sp. NPDC001536 TaxID=3364583 RepID=UPI0036A1DDB2
MESSAEDLERIKRTPNRDIGNPITERCQGEALCMDYLQATFELGFIERAIDLSPLLDGYLQGQAAVQMALENGPFRQLLDIQDSAAVQTAVPAFISGYRPGDAWDCVGDSRALPWSYLWKARTRSLLSDDVQQIPGDHRGELEITDTLRAYPAAGRAELVRPGILDFTHPSND